MVIDYHFPHKIHPCFLEFFARLIYRCVEHHGEARRWPERSRPAGHHIPGKIHAEGVGFIPAAIIVILCRGRCRAGCTGEHAARNERQIGRNAVGGNDVAAGGAARIGDEYAIADNGTGNGLGIGAADTVAHHTAELGDAERGLRIAEGEVVDGNGLPVGIGGGCRVVAIDDRDGIDGRCEGCNDRALAGGI